MAGYGIGGSRVEPDHISATSGVCQGHVYVPATVVVVVDADTVKTCSLIAARSRLPPVSVAPPAPLRLPRCARSRPSSAPACYPGVLAPRLLWLASLW